MNSYKALSKQKFSHLNFDIVPIRAIDKFEIMKWRNEQIYHLRQSKPLTKSDQNEYFENVVSNLFDQEKPSQILFSFLKDGHCIGYGGLVHMNWIDRNAEISFIMNTELENSHFVEYWETFLLLIQRVAFNNLEFHKIFTYAYDLRPKLYRALESRGFKKEAVLKEHCFFEGRYIDVVLHSKINKLVLRKASYEDVILTYSWATNENIRKYSFSKEKILFEKHSDWFSRKLNDPNCHYYILEDSSSTSLGSIRIDRENKDGVISYLIDPKYHGLGLGQSILRLLEGTIQIDDNQIHSLVGYVIKENIASIRIFEKLKYSKEVINGRLKFIKEIR